MHNYQVCTLQNTRRHAIAEEFAFWKTPQIAVNLNFFFFKCPFYRIQVRRRRIYYYFYNDLTFSNSVPSVTCLPIF